MATNKTEIVGERLLKRELNSRRFIDGLEKAIDITIKTGCEASFSIDKRVFRRRIVYPTFICVGDKKHTGFRAGERYARKLYKEETGKKPLDSKGIMNWDFFRFCMNRNLVSMKYPEVEKEYDYTGVSDEFYKESYELFDLHTHASDITLPSRRDISSLNALRKINQRRYGIPLNPISIIVATQLQNNKYNMVFFQEKNKSPLEENELRESNRLYLWHELLSSVFSKSRRYHNIGFAFFDPKKKEIDFRFSLRNFAFRYEKK